MRCGATCAPWGSETSTAIERMAADASERIGHGAFPAALAAQLAFVMFQTTRGGGNNDVATRTAVPTFTLAAFPALRLVPVIYSRERIPAMAQVPGRSFDLAETAITQKRRLIRIFSRDGLIDDEELAILQAQEEHASALYEKADDEVYAAAVVKLGRRNNRVQRLTRELFPDFDPAA